MKHLTVGKWIELVTEREQVGSCFGHVHGTVNPLCTAVRDRLWLEYGSRWPLDAAEKIDDNFD